MQGIEFISNYFNGLSAHWSPAPKNIAAPVKMIPGPSQEENIHAQSTSPAKRIRLSASQDPKADLRRESVGGKGMFLEQMQRIGLSVPEFQCVTTEMVAAIEQHSLDVHHLASYIPGIAGELASLTCLADIKTHIDALPAVSRDKRTQWLAGLSQFIASHDFYELVKDSEAARKIRSLEMPLPPLIVRSSGINEDNYGDAQAGKFLSEVQGGEDVLRTCFKVMASGYRPEVCTGLQRMALVIQHCIDCLYGGVAMSYKSLRDNEIRIEYTPGQPKGAVAGLFQASAHRIDIKRNANHSEFTPGEIPRCFTLQRSPTTEGGYTEVEITNPVSDSKKQRLSDDLVAQLKQAVMKLEDLLLCPVDVEFAIDHQDHLFLLQVRPITRLSGGMDFAMSAPSDTLATGEGISEGYCTGTLWSGTHQDADTMPEGAIVIARHGETWMLEPEHLGRAGGFVFAAGGSNDHVAITLRQAGKPYLLAGKQYPAVRIHHGQQATLACAHFNGTPQAFLVEGDFSAELTRHQTASSASDALPLPNVQASRDDLLPPEGTFDRVDTSFRWLTGQNARLLAFFAPAGGLDYLSSPIALSMSAQRAEILAATRGNINQLIQGAEALLRGYQAFLLPAGNNPQIKPLLDELPGLITRFGRLKKSIATKLDRISLDNSKAPAAGRFRQWTDTVKELQSCLLTLDPSHAHQVESVHDLIFALHQRFVNALGAVASASGQGRLTVKENTTWVDYTRPGEGLLRPFGKACIEQLSNNPKTVVNMDGALIVKVCLGGHTSVIELLENAEAGKGRTLRLTFSDQIYSTHGSDKPGKLARMWFLVQLLKAAGVHKHASDMKVGINAEAGAMTVEFSRMPSKKTMQDAFETLTSLLGCLADLDFCFKKYPPFGAKHWDFNMLARLLDSDGSTQADRFAFNQCLFVINHIYQIGTHFYYRFLSKQQQHIIDLALQLKKCTGNPQEILTCEKIDPTTRREILHHLLLLNSNMAMPLLEQAYNLQNKYFMLKPCHGYSLQFAVDPDQADHHKSKIKRVLLDHGMEFASQSLRNDKDAALPRLKKDGMDLKYVSELLKRDKEVVMAAVCQNGNSLRFASPEIQDDDEVVLAATREAPHALNYASERIKNDKNFVRQVCQFNIYSLSHASKRLLNDREYMLSLIELNAQAYLYCSTSLTNDPSFRDAAVQRNPRAPVY